MRISVKSRNGGKALLEKDQISKIKNLVKFCAVMLMNENILVDLKIDVILDAELYSREKDQGTAIWEDERHRAREFTIEVDTGCSFRTIIHTVAHEMVHVKQWATGEKFEYSNKADTIFFKNKKYNAAKIDYWDYPWEIEAFGRTPGLVLRWAKKHGYEHEAWTRTGY